MQLVKWQSWDLKLCLSGSAILTYSSILKMHVFMIWISSLDWQFFECRGQLLVILCIFWIKKKWMHISWLMPLTSFSWFLSLGQANWIWVERRGVLIKDESLSQNGPELWDLQRTALRSNGLTPEGAAWGHSWLFLETSLRGIVTMGREGGDIFKSGSEHTGPMSLGKFLKHSVPHIHY